MGRSHKQKLRLRIFQKFCLLFCGPRAIFYRLGAHLTLLGLLVIGGGVGYTRATYISSIANKHISSHHRATTLSSIGMLRRITLVPLSPAMGWVSGISLPVALIIVSLFPLSSLLIKEEI